MNCIKTVLYCFRSLKIVLQACWSLQQKRSFELWTRLCKHLPPHTLTAEMGQKIEVYRFKDVKFQRTAASYCIIQRTDRAVEADISGHPVECRRLFLSPKTLQRQQQLLKVLTAAHILTGWKCRGAWVTVVFSDEQKTRGGMREETKEKERCLSFFCEAFLCHHYCCNLLRA